MISLLTGLAPVGAAVAATSELLRELREAEGDAGSFCDAVLKWLDLSQAQIAVLLGVTPQAVSKWVKEEGVAFLAKDRRAQRLYSALRLIGGERYTFSASRLMGLAREEGWGEISDIALNGVDPANLYGTSDELWIVSDSPGRIIDWPELRSVVFSDRRAEREKLVAVFTSTMEGAEQWAEMFEREAISTAIDDKGDIDAEKGRVFQAYVYIIVTNITMYSCDCVISNPGSLCMVIFASQKSPSTYQLCNGMYFAIGTAMDEFTRISHAVGIGADSAKINFFPTGVKLGREVFDYPPRFTDTVIAKRGRSHDDDRRDEERGLSVSQTGNGMAGGILRTTDRRSESAIRFNKQSKFCPIYLLAYKRRPGDSFNKTRTLRIVHDELDRQKKNDSSNTGDGGVSNHDFW